MLHDLIHMHAGPGVGYGLIELNIHLFLISVSLVSLCFLRNTFLCGSGRPVIFEHLWLEEFNCAQLLLPFLSYFFC